MPLNEQGEELFKDTRASIRHWSKAKEFEDWVEMHEAILGNLALWISEWRYCLDRSSSEKSENMKSALQAALRDDPDWRRLAVEALDKAEGRK
jgi:hypothetical protein